MLADVPMGRFYFFPNRGAYRKKKLERVEAPLLECITKIPKLK